MLAYVLLFAGLLDAAITNGVNAAAAAGFAQQIFYSFHHGSYEEDRISSSEICMRNVSVIRYMCVNGTLHIIIIIYNMKNSENMNLSSYGIIAQSTTTIYLVNVFISFEKRLRYHDIYEKK